MPPISAGLLCEDGVEPRAVETRETGLDVARMSAGSGMALSTIGRVPVAIEPHQPLEVRQDGERAAASGRGDALRAT